MIIVLKIKKKIIDLWQAYLSPSSSPVTSILHITAKNVQGHGKQAVIIVKIISARLVLEKWLYKSLIILLSLNVCPSVKLYRLKNFSTWFNSSLK